MQLAASPPASSSEGLHGLSDQSLSSFVRFNLVDCEWEVATIGILAVLTREVALLHLHDTHEATTSNSSAGVSESTTAGLAEAQRAQEFYKRSTLLFKKLSKNMGSCKTGHTAKVNLSGFGVCKPDLKMLLSTCPDPKPNSWGHPATCSEQR